MNSTPSILCSLFLVAMIAAGFSHHWSVQSLLVQQPNIPAVPRAVPGPAPDRTLETEVPQKPVIAASTQEEIQSSPSKDEFFNTLIAELKNLKNENRNLRDQMGETNRDVMKLAFRVDTHSESFRPMPESEQRNDTSSYFEEEDFSGVLPPRAEPVMRDND